MRRAGLLRGTVVVSTDGPAALRFIGLPQGSQVAGDEGSVFVGTSGVATVRVPRGRITLTVS